MAKKILFNSSDEIVTKYAEKDIHGDDIDVGELTAAINNKKLYSHTITLKQDGGSKYFHLQKLYSTQKSSAITTVQGLAELLNVGANASDNLYCRAGNNALGLVQVATYGGSYTLSVYEYSTYGGTGTSVTCSIYYDVVKEV